MNVFFKSRAKRELKKHGNVEFSCFGTHSWGRFGFDGVIRRIPAARRSAVLRYQRATKINANNVVKADFSRAQALAA